MNVSHRCSNVADTYLRERVNDFRDVGHRVLRHLKQEGGKAPFSRRTVLVADELTLSQLTLVSHEHLVGIALQSGGVTSHAAILARAFEIPTVVGIEHLMEGVSEGDDLVLDGNSGVLFINPTVEIEREYEGLHKRYDAFKREPAGGAGRRDDDARRVPCGDSRQRRAARRSQPCAALWGRRRGLDAFGVLVPHLRRFPGREPAASGSTARCWRRRAAGR